MVKRVMSNRLSFTLISFAIILFLGAIVFAYDDLGNPSVMGHSLDELSSGTFNTGDYVFPAGAPVEMYENLWLKETGGPEVEGDFEGAKVIFETMGLGKTGWIGLDLNDKLSIVSPGSFDIGVYAEDGGLKFIVGGELVTFDGVDVGGNLKVEGNANLQSLRVSGKSSVGPGSILNGYVYCDNGIVFEESSFTCNQPRINVIKDDLEVSFGNKVVWGREDKVCFALGGREKIDASAFSGAGVAMLSGLKDDGYPWYVESGTYNCVESVTCGYL